MASLSLFLYSVSATLLPLSVGSLQLFGLGGPGAHCATHLASKSHLLGGDTHSLLKWSELSVSWCLRWHILMCESIRDIWLLSNERGLGEDFASVYICGVPQGSVLGPILISLLPKTTGGGDDGRKRQIHCAWISDGMGLDACETGSLRMLHQTILWERYKLRRLCCVSKWTVQYSCSLFHRPRPLTEVT